MINQNWVFGNNAGLDFSTSPPTPTQGFPINTSEGCASISDNSGTLLFYTDGKTVWDAAGTPQVTGLLGNSSSTQSAIIVPDPGNSNQFYIFTADQQGSAPNHFNGGRLNINTWAFTTLSSLMTMPSTSGFSPSEKITAIQHENCEDYWIITILQEAPLAATNGAGIVRIFEVTASGIQHFSDTPMGVNVNDIGYLKGSPNGQKIAIANYTTNNLYVYPFNNSTGIVNTGGLVTISPVTASNYGIEFSPNSTMLYYNEYNTGNINQVNLTGTLTSNLVGSIGYRTGALQLGMDGVIYIAEHNRNTIGAILNPDTPGAGCNITPAYITLLSGSRCLFGLPNLITNPCPEEGCDCGCTGCNKESDKQNEELIDRANKKFHTVKSGNNCPDPFPKECERRALDPNIKLEPCFYFHWGDGSNDQIEEHDTEVFYLTVCNHFTDIQYDGLRITKVTLVPNIHPLDKIHIVPDRFINLDCLAPCSCQTREFAMITRANDTAGNYRLEVEYCYEGISLSDSGRTGKAGFPLEITED